MKIGVVHMYPSQYLLDTYVKLGHEVYLFSPYDPCMKSVVWQYDPFEDKSTILERLSASCRALNIDIFPAVYEGAVEIIAALSQDLNLPAFSLESAQASRNKYLGYNCFKEANLPTPKTIVIKLGKNSWADISRELGSPTIVKLADSMNSQGVMKVDSEDSYVDALCELTRLVEQPDTLNYNIDRNRFAYGKSEEKIIAQEYLSGVEFSVDLIFKDSKFLNLGIFEKLPPFDDTFTESASLSPSNLSDEDQIKLVQLAIDAVTSMGAVIGAAHVEIMQTDDGFFLVEAGLRPGGGFTTKCIELLYGINPFEALIEILSDSPRGLTLLENPLVHSGFTMFGGVRYKTSGKIANIEGIDILSSSSLIHDFVVLNNIGDNVLAAPNSSQPHLAYYLIKGDSREKALALHKEIQERVQVEVMSEEEVILC